MSKRIDDKTFEKFVQDVKSLRQVHTDAKIATLMETNPGNFSSRINGTKRPGQDFIDRFYVTWGKKLTELAKMARTGGAEMDFPESLVAKERTLDQIIQSYQEMNNRVMRIEAVLFRLGIGGEQFNKKLLENDEDLEKSKHAARKITK